MSAVDQDGKLDPRGTSERGHGIHRRPATAAREEDVIDQNERPPVEVQGEFRQFEDADPGAGGEVIPVHGDVDDAKGGRLSLDLGDMGRDSAGNRLSTRGDAGDDESGGVSVLLDNLVRDPSDRFADRLGIHDPGDAVPGFGGAVVMFGFGCFHCPWRPLGTALKDQEGQVIASKRPWIDAMWNGA